MPIRLRLKNKSTASLQRGKTTPNNCPEYYTKQSDGEAPVLLELWEMNSTSLLPSLPGPLWPRVVAPVRVLPMDQIELNRGFENLLFFALKLLIYAKQSCLK